MVNQDKLLLHETGSSLSWASTLRTNTKPSKEGPRGLTRPREPNLQTAKRASMTSIDLTHDMGYSPRHERKLSGPVKNSRSVKPALPAEARGRIIPKNASAAAKARETREEKFVWENSLRPSTQQRGDILRKDFKVDARPWRAQSIKEGDEASAASTPTLREKKKKDMSAGHPDAQVPQPSDGDPVPEPDPSTPNQGPSMLNPPYGTDTPVVASSTIHPSAASRAPFATEDNTPPNDEDLENELSRVVEETEVDVTFGHRHTGSTVIIDDAVVGLSLSDLYETTNHKRTSSGSSHKRTKSNLSGIFKDKEDTHKRSESQDSVGSHKRKGSDASHKRKNSVGTKTHSRSHSRNLSTSSHKRSESIGYVLDEPDYGVAAWEEPAAARGLNPVWEEPVVKTEPELPEVDVYPQETHLEDLALAGLPEEAFPAEESDMPEETFPKGEEVFNMPGTYEEKLQQAAAYMYKPPFAEEEEDVVPDEPEPYLPDGPPIDEDFKDAEEVMQTAENNTADWDEPALPDIPEPSRTVSAPVEVPEYMTEESEIKLAEPEPTPVEEVEETLVEETPAEETPALETATDKEAASEHDISASAPTPIRVRAVSDQPQPSGEPLKNSYAGKKLINQATVVGEMTVKQAVDQLAEGTTAHKAWVRGSNNKLKGSTRHVKAKLAKDLLILQYQSGILSKKKVEVVVSRCCLNIEPSGTILMLDTDNGTLALKPFKPQHETLWALGVNALLHLAEKQEELDKSAALQDLPWHGIVASAKNA